MVAMMLFYSGPRDPILDSAVWVVPCALTVIIRGRFQRSMVTVVIQQPCMATSCGAQGVRVPPRPIA